MKVGERGRVTIPKEIRNRFRIGPEKEVEFDIAGDSIVLRKKSTKLNLKKWKGRCKESFAKHSAGRRRVLRHFGEGARRRGERWLAGYLRRRVRRALRALFDSARVRRFPGRE